MRWLDLLHIADSAFPSGAFGHSFGLESLAPTGVAGLRAALVLRLRESLGRLELVFVVHAFQHPLASLDERLHAMLLGRETREASALIGTALLRSACDLLDVPSLSAFLRDGPHRHHPIAWAAIAHALDVPPQAAAEIYAFNAVRGYVSAAQRLGWLGQRDAHRLLHTLKGEVQQAAGVAAGLSLDQAGAFTPTWDIAGMAHERAAVRLFAS